jgi:hypothetical protein
MRSSDIAEAASGGCFNSRMTTWEYRTFSKSHGSVKVLSADHDSELEAATVEPGTNEHKLLKRAGELGWELVAVTVTPETDDVTIYYLKKPADAD